MTKKTGYGLIAMVYLAGLPEGQLASARQIAERFSVPRSLLMNVLKRLAATGYVQSVRGARGGYRLARPPEEISVVDVAGELQGPIRMAKCVTDEATGRECTREVMARCPIADPVHRVQRRINDFLRKVTLAEIVDPTAAPAGK